MRRAGPVLLILAFAASPTWAAPKPADAVKALELQRFEATVKNDLEALGKLLADDLTYTHSNGAVDTKAQYIEALKSGKVRYDKIEPGELQVRLYGNTAIINGEAKLSVVSEGQTKALSLRFTDVWARRAGRWQMVAWQSTRLP